MQGAIMVNHELQYIAQDVREAQIYNNCRYEMIIIRKQVKLAEERVQVYNT